MYDAFTGWHAVGWVALLAVVVTACVYSIRSVDQLRVPPANKRKGRHMPTENQPSATNPPPPAPWAVALFVVVLILVLGPVVLWCLGNVVIPVWEWSLRWV